MIGAGNRFAHAAALAVAELPAQAYNPLFLHGSPGLGKTHLLHAIAAYVGRHGSGLRVRYATIEEFTSEFVEALRARRTAGFKERFRTADVVLIDDVQFLAGRAKTREEFFHTFNALLDSGRQLVLTSDRGPRRSRTSKQRLTERFRAGLVVELDRPTLAVRRAILADPSSCRRCRRLRGGAGRDRDPGGYQRSRARGRPHSRGGLRLTPGRAAHGGARAPCPCRLGGSSRGDGRLPVSIASSTPQRTNSESNGRRCWPATAAPASPGRAT